jgi:hypothetical protein
VSIAVGDVVITPRGIGRILEVFPIAGTTQYQVLFLVPQVVLLNASQVSDGVTPPVGASPGPEGASSPSASGAGFPGKRDNSQPEPARSR